MKTARALVGLVALITGCTESTTPFDPAEITLAAASPTSLTVVAGSSVTDLPAVVAQDKYGKPRAGIAVSFAVSVGKSRLAGISAITDNSGLARLQEWTPDTKAGPAAVVAAAPNGSSVVFSALVVAGPATQIIKVAGDNQIAPVQSEVPIKPKAKVADAYGNPVASVRVRFALLEAQGAVTPAEAVSDAEGIVSPSSWTLGDVGEQHLIVSAGNFAQEFRATAARFAADCSQPIQLLPAVTVASQLTAGCTVNGRLYTTYFMSVTDLALWTLDMQSSAFDSYLEIRDASSNVVARDDDAGGSHDSKINALIPRGLYQVIASSNSPGIGGPFSLSLKPPPFPIGCDPVWVVKGVSTSTQLVPVTCNGVALGNMNLYRIRLAAGDRLSVALTDLTYSGYDLEIMDADGKTLATGVSTTSYLDYEASYSADKDVELTVKVSSIDTYAEYAIAFR